MGDMTVNYDLPGLEDNDGARITLGSVEIPEDFRDHDKLDQLLSIVTDLVEQMIEEDIIPELTNGDTDSRPVDPIAVEALGPLMEKPLDADFGDEGLLY